MEQFWSFVNEHWFIAFLLVGGVISGVVTILYALLFRLPNRIIRHCNIARAGWPPAHLDADGDFKNKEEEEEEP
jgi:hypothetical protein